MDGAVDDEVLDHLDRIKIYPIKIQSEDDLIKEIARIANLSMKLGYQLEAENRNLSKEEAYIQLGIVLPFSRLFWIMFDKGFFLKLF